MKAIMSKIKKMNDKERLVMFSIIEDKPLKDIAKFTNYSYNSLKNTHRLLIWYLRYAVFIEQYKSYIKYKLSNILLYKKGHRISDWGRKLVLKMFNFPIRNTAYWAQKLKYELRGNVSGSVLAALFVAENRIEEYLIKHPEDVILKRWYLLFRVIQFGTLNFNKRFRYKAHLFRDLSEWEFVKSEIKLRDLNNRALKAEIKRLLNQNLSVDEITKFIGNVEPEIVNNIVSDIASKKIDYIVKELWEELRDFEKVYRVLKDRKIRITRRKLQNILLENVDVDSLMKQMFCSGLKPKEIKKEMYKLYGLKLNKEKLYILSRKWRKI